jgi:tetratricopeptide (TPR) repeat protein
VALWFSLDVNRVFDMPKALALKTGGCGLGLLWLAYGLFGRGFAWRSARLFVAPVFAMIAATAISTLLSIDPWMSLVGVYERQFGLQGLMACGGLFLLTATGLRSKRNAVAALGALMVIGASISAYAWLQSKGLDPWGFFKKPHNKVYATLGNATFAGNALALIFPISLVLAVVLSVKRLAAPVLGLGDEDEGPTSRLIAWGLGLALALALFLLPGYLAGLDETLGAESRQARFKFGVGFAAALIAFLHLVGSAGPAAVQLESPSSRRLADAAGAGALAACAGLLVIGLFTTRTRGAWVGTAVALTGMLVLLPLLFSEQQALFKRAAMGGGGLLLVFVLGLSGWILAMPDHVVSRTIKSIPYAFMPEKTVYGQGQGTRPYLWGESPRVLMNHEGTLARLEADRADYFAQVPEAQQAPDARPTDWLPAGLRRVLVWPFGIGIETYRFAFMSHKSKKLEALDPMTNHDNPHNNYLYVLASGGLVGLLAYLWLLWRLLSTAWSRFRDTESSRADRAVAFGVVTSFFSYSVYSIAGFDSVACSVFLFYLLGVAATFFAPSEDEARQPLVDHVRAQWAEFRGRERPGPAELVPPVAVGLLLVLGAPLAHTVWSIQRLHSAEQAFVGGEIRSFDDKIKQIERAIELNPNESYYRQSLGGRYADASRQYRQLAAQARSKGDDRGEAYVQLARESTRKAESALYAALNHSWAPENVFISLFQLYYGLNDLQKAELALERGLTHSPHLAPVRANLAVLKLGRENWKGALDDALWVLDIDPANLHALRTAGRAYHQLGELEQALVYLDKARQYAPSDAMVRSFLADLERSRAAKTTTTAGG